MASGGGDAGADEPGRRRVAVASFRLERRARQVGGRRRGPVVGGRGRRRRRGGAFGSATSVSRGPGWPLALVLLLADPGDLAVGRLDGREQHHRRASSGSVTTTRNGLVASGTEPPDHVTGVRARGRSRRPPRLRGDLHHGRAVGQLHLEAGGGRPSSWCEGERQRLGRAGRRPRRGRARRGPAGGRGEAHQHRRQDERRARGSVGGACGGGRSLRPDRFPTVRWSDGARPLDDPARAAGAGGHRRLRGLERRGRRRHHRGPLPRRPVGPDPVADVDPEEFYDFTSTRPEVRLDDDGLREIDWPATEIHAGTIPGGDQDVIVIIGTEPQLRWRTYCEELTRGRAGHGARLVHHPRRAARRGAPHAADPGRRHRLRPRRRRRARAAAVPLRGTHRASSACCTTRGATPGLRSASLWATVPAYVPGAPSPKAALALVERTSAMLQTLGAHHRPRDRGGVLRAAGERAGRRRRGDRHLRGQPRGAPRRGPRRRPQRRVDRRRGRALPPRPVTARRQVRWRRCTDAARRVPGAGAGRVEEHADAARRGWRRRRGRPTARAPIVHAGQLVLGEPADVARLERVGLQLAAGGPAEEHHRVQRDAGEAHAHAVEHGDHALGLALDAGLLAHLLHRHLGRRVADVGPAGRVEPDAGVGPLHEQDPPLVVVARPRRRPTSGVT